MRISRFVLFTAVSGLVSAAALGGCSSSDTSTSSSSSGGDPTCDPTEACVSELGVTSECLALVDNTGSASPGLRISQLKITQPPVLATGAVSSLVGEAVELDKPNCNLTGTGTFSWLMQFNGSTLKTGGAKPTGTPEAGFCFVNETVGGQAVAPIEIDAPIGSDGSFSADVGADVVVPIYLDQNATEVVLLPLNGARLYNGMLSADKNCIGSYNGAGLDPVNLCLPEEGIPTFINGAKLEGFITLEQADAVIVDSLSSSLCVLLAGSSTFATDDPIKVCTRDANNVIDYKGDWCAAANGPADQTCADAVKLGAEFAASAVKINGDCP